jgi:tetratricopeptide (TPR) repeat protein
VFAAQLCNYFGRPEEARTHLQRARDLLRFGDAAPDRGLLLTEEAKVAARLGDSRRALELAREADGLLAGHIRHAPNATHALAVAHAALGEVDVADAEFDRAVTALADREQWREAIYVARDWAEALRAAGRGERAYAVLEQATSFGQRMGVPPTVARADPEARQA